MKDTELILRTCKKRTSTAYRFEKMKWSDLIDRLKETKRTAETVKEYRQKSKDDQNAIKDVGGYVMGDLKDGKRGRESVTCRCAVTLDLDFAPVDFWKRFALEFDYAALVYSTHKHTPKTPKLRLIVPLSRTVTPDEYEAIARKLAEEWLELDWCDDTTFQPSRMMFWPSTSADGEYVFEVQEGEILDPQIVLDLYEGHWDDMSRWPYSSRVEEKREKLTARKQQDPTAKEGAIGSFCRTYTIQEAIRKFIPEVYTETDREDRWTYTAGTTAGGLVIYDNDTFAYSNHSTDPAGDFHCLNAFDLVRVHKFRHLDKDHDSSKGAALPSFRAMADLASADKEVQKTISAEMFDRQVEGMEDVEDETGISAEEFAEANAEWQHLLVRHPKTGKLEETIENVITILENDIKLKGLGRYNAFQDFVEKDASLPWWKYDSYSKEWGEADTTELITYLEKWYDLHSERVIKRGRDAIHMRRAFHPVKDYLDGLPDWDGKERLDSLLVDYMGADDDEYTRSVTRKTLVAAIKRIYEPGCKVDYVLTLEGQQGMGKTTFFRSLPPDDAWFSDSMDTFVGKEAYEALMGSWIIELGELAAAKRADVERVKQFITKQDDKFRKAYAEKLGRYRRQCIFVATTNSSDFLRDMTGNRRWWVVHSEKGRATKTVAQLDEERDQIWAEAKKRYQDGETLYLPADIEAIANEVQDEYTYKSVRYEAIEEYLNMKLPENWADMELVSRQTWLESPDTPAVMKRDKVCLLEIWQECFGGTRMNFSNLDQREISDILQKLHWKRAKGKRRFGPVYGQQRAFIPPDGK